VIGYRFILIALVLLLVHSGRVYSQCSIVSLEGPDTIRQGDALKITAKVSSNSPNQPQFKWYISAGTITSDPQASTILVDTAGLGGQSIITTVKIIGIQTDCSAEASLVTRIDGGVICGLAFDEYGDIKFIDEKSRLDNFAIQILNEPGSRGHLLAYAGQRTYPNEAAERLKRAKNYLVKVRHIDPERIITVDGGHRQELVVTLRVLPAGVSAPPTDPWGLLTADKLDFSKPRHKPSSN
jgi:hypothetical protein